MLCIAAPKVDTKQHSFCKQMQTMNLPKLSTFTTRSVLDINVQENVHGSRAQQDRVSRQLSP